MSSNKGIKKRLIQRYGSIDFLDRMKIKIPEKKRYKSKGQYKRMKQLTYHHIREKSKGGDATIENGALLTAEHHEWFHQQPPEIQRQLNEKFQELKRRIDAARKVSVVLTDEELDFSFEFNFAELSIDKQGRIKAYNRSKKKKQDREIIDEYEEDLE
jgi:hypothetical protein